MLFNAIADLKNSVYRGSISQEGLRRMARNTPGQMGDVARFLASHYPTPEEIEKRKQQESRASANQLQAKVEVKEKPRFSLGQDYRNFRYYELDKREDRAFFDLFLTQLQKQYRESDDLNAFMDMIPMQFLDDAQIALSLLKVSDRFMPYLSDRLKADESFFHLAFQVSEKNFPYFAESIRGNVLVVEPILKQNPMLLAACSDSIKSNQTLVLYCIERNVLCFQFADATLRANEAINTACIEKNPLLIRFVPKEALSDAFILKAVFHDDLKQKSHQKRSFQVIESHPKRSFPDIEKNNSFQQAKRWIQMDPLCYRKLKKQLQTHPLLIDLALSLNGLVLSFVPTKLITEKRLKLAIQQNPFAISFAPEKLITEALLIEAMKANPEVILYL
jgi:hypothetical protein